MTAAPVVARKPVAVSSSDELQDLSLRVWEAASYECSIIGIQEVVARELRPFIPFDGITFVSFEEDGPRHHELFFVHLPTGLARIQNHPLRTDEENCSSPLRQPDPYCMEDIKRRWCTGKPFICLDLLAKPIWQEYEYRLGQCGMRSYVLHPLLVRGKLIAAAIFSRSQSQAFSSEQLLTLRRLAPALAAAFANALRNSKASELIERLRGENARLRAELNRVSRMEDEVDSANTPAISGDVMKMSSRLQNEERRLIEQALLGSRGRVSGANGAAIRLGMQASTLEFRIRRLGIDKFQYRRRNRDRPR
jgi:GAF domain-containing protein